MTNQEGSAEVKPAGEVEDFCTRSGRLAGASARRIYNFKKKVKEKVTKLGKSIYETTRKATSICKSTGRKCELRRAKRKRQTLLTQLGTEVSRQVSEQAQDVLSQSKVREIVEQIREIEKHIEETGRGDQAPQESEQGAG